MGHTFVGSYNLPDTQLQYDHLVSVLLVVPLEGSNYIHT